MRRSKIAFRALIGTVACGASLALSNAIAQENDQDVILVLDGSGSMWGQIEGEAKISIARSVVGQVIDDLSSDQRLGLVAYGHNREGDCSDIEEVVSVGTDRAAIRSAVDRINPKGKTPLSAAVQFAAERLRYTEDKATVILISDGRETCGLDPCSIGSSLEQSGIDFTAHVIGFDVVEQADQEQLQCLADNTGGVYLNASNSEELSQALEQTVAEVPVQDANTQTQIYLRATDLAQGPEIESGLTWRVSQAGGGDDIFSQSDLGGTDIEVEPGVYDIFVDWPETGLSGKAEGVQIAQSAEKTVTIALEQAFDATLRTVPVGAAPVSSETIVHWSGPDREGDWISVTDKDGGPSSYQTYTYTNSGGNPLAVRMPAEPGIYEMRYVLGRPARVLARLEIEATPVSATLEAPDEIAAGKMIDVVWAGPGYDDDWITVVKPDADDTAYNDYAYTRDGERLAIKAPLQAGDYELRYLQAGEKIIARRPIVVSAVEASMDAPSRVEIGSYHDIAWTGPGGDGDWLTIVRPGERPGAYTDYAYTRDGATLNLRMPLEPGNYELRYVQDGKKVLASNEMVVTDLIVGLNAPARASAGSTIEVGFDGPGWQGDWLTVVAPDASETSYGDYKYGRDGSPVSLKMPVAPGTYQLRYVLDGKRVVGTRDITIEDAEAGLSAPDTVGSGDRFAIEWTGPGHHSDWVTIVDPQAHDESYGSYSYPRYGNPLELTAPSAPGVYELRYVLDGKRVIARKSITVE